MFKIAASKSSEEDKAKADAAGTSTGVEIVMCVTEAGILENAKGRWLLMGGVRDDTWAWASGGLPLYISAATAGAITATPPGNNIRIVGYTRDDDRIRFCPNNAFTA